MKNMRLAVFGVTVLLFLGMIARYGYSQTKPTVVSTNPSNGATGVSPDIRSFSVTFSKAMTAVCGAATENWVGAGEPGSGCVWSADLKTMTVSRGSASAPIGAGLTVSVSLNPSGMNPWVRDTEGNYLDPYTFSFKINNPSSLDKIAPAPQKGFQWPYYLYVPPVIKKPAVLLVEPNNTGTANDDPSVHEVAASNLINAHKSWASDLGSPFLVPTFPRPRTNWQVYTQALDRDTLTANLPGLTRLDLQLLAMIDDARERLAAKGIDVGPKVWMIGYSASGSFVNRFAVLHPDRVQAMSAGSGGEYAIAPVSVWKGKTLRYPVGVADLQQLTGQPFDTAAFRKVPVQIYIGDLQVDDAVNYTDGYDPEDAALIKEVFGGPTFRRYPASEAAYVSIGSDCQFVIFPGVGHVWPDWSFIREFLERNRAEPFPPPLPKPTLYKIYFPHVASFGGWETEIALTNTSDVAVHGQLQAYTAGGILLSQSIPVVLPPLGRREIVLGTSFQNPENIAYMAFLGDSGFLAGYTRFWQTGNRVSLAAIGTGTKRGWFTKIEDDGWTGVAFVNVDDGDATVELNAWDANAGQVAATTVMLRPGEKYVSMVDQLFPVDLSNTKYFTFKSDQDLLGFTVTGSADGLMLDGLHCLSDYIK